MVVQSNIVKKVLLINIGGIGDEILFFPTIKSVKETYPHAEITLALEPRSKSAKELCPFIDKIICIDFKSKFKYFEAIKFLFKVWTESFDVVFSAGSSNFVALLLFLTGIKKRYGFYSGKLSEKLLTGTAKLNKAQYAANMYHDLIKIVNPNAICEIPSIPHGIAEKSGKPVVLIHPGVSLMSIKKNIIKGIDATIWANLINKLLDTKQYKVILAGGKDDAEIIKSINEKLKNERDDFSDFSNMYGRTKSLNDFIDLICCAAVMVCVDSAPLHMAIATNTPVVTIFGPTNEKVLVPQRNNIRVLTVKDLPCRPCLWNKRQTSCDSKECLKLTANEIFEAVEGMLVR